MASSETVYAKVIGCPGFADSAVGSAAYTITSSQAGTPTFSPAAGAYSSAQSVTISTSTPGCSGYIHWNTTGNPTSGDTQGTSVSVAASETVYAKVIGCPGFADSAVGSAAYTINSLSQAATPTFSPAAGAYSSAQSVTISTSTPGCSGYIYWNTTGNPTSGDTQGTSVSVASSETVYAKVIGCPGFADSAVGSAAYTISGIGYVSASHTICLQTTAASTQTCTLSGATTAGDDVVVGLVWNTVGQTIASTVGSSGAQFFLYAQSCGANECAALMVCRFCAAQTTVTPTFSGTTVFAIGIQEYSGGFILGIPNIATATSTTPGTTTPTGDANNWIVTVTGSLGNAGIPTSGTGNLRDANRTGTTSSDVGIGMVDNTAASPGSVVTTDTITSGEWAAASIEIRSTAPRAYIYPDCDATHPCVIHAYASITGASDSSTLQDFKLSVEPSRAGNLIVVVVSHPSAKTLTLTDNNSQTWASGPTTTNATDAETTEMKYICGATAGTKLMTLHFSSASAPNDNFQFSYAEVSGIATSSCGDGNDNANGVVTPGVLQAATGVTPSQTGDLFLTYTQNSSNAMETSDSSWIMPDDKSAILIENNFEWLASSVRVEATSGSVINPALYVGGFTASANRWNVITQAFKASNGAGTQPTGIHVTRVMKYVGGTGGASPIWVPFPSQGNAIVVDTSNNQSSFNMTNVGDALGKTWTKLTIPDPTEDPQVFSTCMGSSNSSRDETFYWTVGANNTHVVLYDIAGAKTTGGSQGCVGATVNHVQGSQPNSANAAITGDPTLTPQASGSVVFTTSYLGAGPPSDISTSNAVYNSMWATGWHDATYYDTGDPWAYIYTTSTSLISFDYTMANSFDAPTGGTAYDGAAIEILGP